MIWLKNFNTPHPFNHFLLSLFLGASVLLISLGSLAIFRPPNRAAAAILPMPALAGSTMLVTFTLDDFDDPQRPPNFTYNIPRPPNDFFANQGQYIIGSSGALITESLTCPFTYSCYLSLAYDVSTMASEGGYVEEVGYSYTYSAEVTSTWTLRDMSECSTFHFRVRGDEAAPFTTQFDVEFVGPDWTVKDHFTVTGVTTNWQVITVPLDSLSPTVVSQLKQVAVRLRQGDVTTPVGLLHFDDFAFIDCQFEGHLLDLIERQAFYYFWENRHPATGFVRDRAVDPFHDRNITSIAAVGFELTAFGIGVERGWITRSIAASATLQVLNSLWEITPTASHRGFFYHLLNIETGQRDNDTELSTIDTALLMAGVIFARQYFTGTDATETAIRQQADQLFNQVEWSWALRTDSMPESDENQFYLAWKPDFRPDYQISAPGGGFFTGTPADPTTWDYYTDEILLINLLAIGSPTHPVLTNTFYAWTREPGMYGDHTFYQSWTGSLFTYFIGQGWLDLRWLAEETNEAINWWENSRKAALANRQFAIDQSITYATYSTQSWGLSANLGPPTEPLTIGLGGVGIYRTYGALPKGELIPVLPLHDGTVAPYAAAGSIVFLGGHLSSNYAYQALNHWFQTQPRLWGLYGFRDGFNLGQKIDDPTGTDPKDDWFAHDHIGIDQGMTLLALENYQTGFVWRIMSRDPVIMQAIDAVFDYYNYLPVILKH